MFTPHWGQLHLSTHLSTLSALSNKNSNLCLAAYVCTRGKSAAAVCSPVFSPAWGRLLMSSLGLPLEARVLAVELGSISVGQRHPNTLRLQPLG